MIFFSNLRRNKETILYFILTILCLEYVRRKHNKLEDTARRENWNKNFLQHKQNLLLIKAGMFYAIFFSLVLLNVLSALTAKITSVYSGTDFLRTNIALGIELILSYILSLIIIKFVLRNYIRTFNKLADFWRKLGRSAWDGTKIVIQTPGRVGMAVKDTVSRGARIGVKTAGDIKCGLNSGVKKTTAFISKIFRKNKIKKTNKKDKGV